MTSARLFRGAGYAVLALVVATMVWDAAMAIAVSVIIPIVGDRLVPALTAIDAVRPSGLGQLALLALGLALLIAPGVLGLEGPDDGPAPSEGR